MNCCAVTSSSKLTAANATGGIATGPVHCDRCFFIACLWLVSIVYLVASKTRPHLLHVRSTVGGRNDGGFDDDAAHLFAIQPPAVQCKEHMIILR